MAFRPNASLIEEDAQKADEREARREGGDLRWYNFKRGHSANILRILPPGAHEDKPPCIPHGNITMPVFKHKGLPGVTDPKESSCIDVGRTFPEKGVACPVAEVLRPVYDFIRANKIERDDSRYIRFFGPDGGKNSYYLYKRAYANVIDRQSTYYLDTTTKQLVPIQMGIELPSHLIPAPMIIGFPLTVNDWLKRQWASKLRPQNERDFTHEETGTDIVIGVIGQGQKTKYEHDMAPCAKPLHPDPAVRQQILDAMYHIGEIFKMPSASEMDRIRGVAEQVRKFSVEVFNLASTSVAVPPNAPVGPASAPAPAAAPAGTNGASLTRVTATGSKLEQPSGAPSCYFNHIIGLQVCLMCPWESGCMTASEKAGIEIAARQATHEAAAREREAHPA